MAKAGRTLSYLDRGFLFAERKETPMHIGGLHLFKLPERERATDFLEALVKELRQSGDLQPPFGQKLHSDLRGALGPVSWVDDLNVDMEYHVRHSALPRPGRFRELFALVSRLHATALEKSRPLWEMHLIEGLPRRQFALYYKFHHAAVDGVRSVHYFRSMYSPDKAYRRVDSPLSSSSQNRYREELTGSAHEAFESEASFKRVCEVAKNTFESSAHIYSSLRKAVSNRRSEGTPIAAPWLDVPATPLNTQVGSARRIVAQTWPFQRIRHVARILGGTFNDAVLAMCSGALRFHLQRQAALPKESLKTLIPVSLRNNVDIESSNAVGMVAADLATNIVDPLKRYFAIQESARVAKAMAQGLSVGELLILTQIVSLPGLFKSLPGLFRGSISPVTSLVISNVPGPNETLYWNGAKLLGMYPLSIVAHGNALNITVLTYDGEAHFGITACRRSLPQVQKLIDDMETALVELENAAGISSDKN